MISLVNRYVRKWLLDLARSARKAAEAAAYRLSLLEEKEKSGPGKETRSNKGKTALLDGPPDHWVQLVRRHAPELLQPGPPHVFSRPEKRITEKNIRTNLSGNAEFPNVEIDGEVSTDTAADLFFSSKSARLFETPETPPEPGEKKQERSFTGGLETSVKTRENFTTGAAPLSSSANQSKIAFDGRTRETIAKRKKTARPGSESSEGNSEPVPPNTLAAKHMTSEAPASFGVFSFSTAGDLDGPSADQTRGKTVRPDSTENFHIEKRTSKFKTKTDMETASSEKFFKIDTKPPAFGKIKKQSLSDTNFGSSGFLKLEKASKVGTTRNSTAQGIKTGYDYSRLEPIQANDSRVRGQSFEQRETADDKRFRTARFHWPRLPEEEDSEDASNAGLIPLWPVLPEEKSVGVMSVLEQMAPPVLEKELREAERLRRLDEEQKGFPWNASYS